MTENWYEKEKLHYAAQDGDIQRVKTLVEQGSSIHDFDEYLGWTPLHYAAKGRHLDVISYLLKEGANVNAHEEEKIGETPLGLVAQDCSYELAKLLVDAGADPTISGWMQLTALDRAARRKKPEGVKVYNLLKKAARL